MSQMQQWPWPLLSCLTSDWDERRPHSFTFSGCALQWTQPPCPPFSLSSKLNLTFKCLSSSLPLFLSPSLPLSLSPSSSAQCASAGKTSLFTFSHFSSWSSSLFHYLAALTSFSHSFSFPSLPSLSLKLLICFGGVKWIAYMWPNFSVDFPKLISCCIPGWISKWELC